MQPEQATQVFTFRQLHHAAVSKGLHVRLHTFDCGQTVYVYDGTTLLARETNECGDTISAVDRVAKWLMEHGWLTMFDFPMQVVPRE